MLFHDKKHKWTANQTRNGIWLDKPEHYFDEGLARQIKETFSGLSILDLGCGWQKKYARYLGCDGYDGNPNTLDGSVIDLSTSFNLKKTYDVVMCLEVMEHIPHKFENVVLDNICNHSKKWVVLSWAPPGYNGRGHVNCQSKNYVIQTMKDKYFILNEELSNLLREKCGLSWIANNIIVFNKVSSGDDPE